MYEKIAIFSEIQGFLEFFKGPKKTPFKPFWP
jgi:hypothetical protein